MPDEASETMVELFLWPSIVLLRKLAMYCTYLVHSTYDSFLFTRATKEGKNVKPTVIPSKSHSIAVFIYSYGALAVPAGPFTVPSKNLDTFEVPLPQFMVMLCTHPAPQRPPPFYLS